MTRNPVCRSNSPVPYNVTLITVGGGNGCNRYLTYRIFIREDRCLLSEQLHAE